LFPERKLRHSHFVRGEIAVPGENPTKPFTFAPANTGDRVLPALWIPACAGMSISSESPQEEKLACKSSSSLLAGIAMPLPRISLLLFLLFTGIYLRPQTPRHSVRHGVGWKSIAHML
jgi:hypothetical protein